MISNVLKVLCFAALMARTSARSKGKFSRGLKSYMFRKADYISNQ